MKFLLIGDGNSIHIKNFVEVVLKDIHDIEITLFDTTTANVKVEDYYNFYHVNNIRVIPDNSLKEIISIKFITRLPIVRTKIHSHLLTKKIRSLGKFNLCILHYVDLLKVIPILNNLELYERIIPVFWGSDLLRNSKINNKAYAKIFEKSYKIIFNTEYMKMYFEKFYRARFVDKSQVIKFPTLSFKKIDKIEQSYTKEELKVKWNLPTEKFVVMCGHSANRAEQHEEIIKAISKCKKVTLEKFYFVFPMTYGAVNLLERQKEIETMLEENDINSKVLKEYIPNEGMLEIISCSDIYISVITTDAFSSVMQENLYTYSYIIQGSWLNYIELKEKNIFFKEIEEIDHLRNSLEDLNNKGLNFKKETFNNKKMISEISAPNNIQANWLKFLVEREK